MQQKYNISAHLKRGLLLTIFFEKILVSDETRLELTIVVANIGSNKYWNSCEKLPERCLINDFRK